MQDVKPSGPPPGVLGVWLGRKPTPTPGSGPPTETGGGPPLGKVCTVPAALGTLVEIPPGPLTVVVPLPRKVVVFGGGDNGATRGTCGPGAPMADRGVPDGVVGAMLRCAGDVNREIPPPLGKVGVVPTALGTFVEIPPGVVTVVVPVPRNVEVPGANGATCGTRGAGAPMADGGKAPADGREGAMLRCAGDMNRENPPPPTDPPPRLWAAASCDRESSRSEAVAVASTGAERAQADADILRSL